MLHCRRIMCRLDSHRVTCVGSLHDMSKGAGACVVRYLSLRRDVHVLDPLVELGHGSHLVEVRREQARRLDGLDDVLRDRPRQPEPVERRCSCSREEVQCMSRSGTFTITFREARTNDSRAVSAPNFGFTLFYTCPRIFHSMESSNVDIPVRGKGNNVTCSRSAI